MSFPALVLFDLDGTLLDSAPDFVATLNRMLVERGEPVVALDALRPHVSKGARAMLAAGFPRLDPDAREAMIPGFLQVYQEELARHGEPFDGIETLLEAIEAAGSRWGIVTNKPEYLARQLGIGADDCVYVGDDERDILAARAARMPSIAALWGYRLHDDDPATWQADVSAATPRALLDPAAWPQAR